MENITETVNVKDIETLFALVEKADRVTVIAHISPDGDALGSALAWMHLLEKMGKNVSVVTPDTPPASLSFLPGVEKVVSGTVNSTMARGLVLNADLLICTDFSQADRAGALSDAVKLSRARKAVIDHHNDPDIEADVMVSHPLESSTCALLFRILWQGGRLGTVPVEGLTTMLAGMLTDTGNLSYNAKDPDLYRMVAVLVSMGVDKDRLVRELFNTYPLRSLRIKSYALDRKLKVYPEHRAAVISLSNEELKSLGYVKGDTEGLVNVPMGIPEVVYSIFLREDSKGEKVRVSVRSKGDFPAHIFCSRHFGGGGHDNAAGGDVAGTIDDAIEKVERTLPLFDCYLP